METIESFFTPRDQYFRTSLSIDPLWRGGTFKNGLLLVLLIAALGLALSLEAAEFTCASGDVACLINAINQANANGEANRITLRRGTYTLTVVDNGTFGNTNGLPVITSPLTITGRGAETTIIERDTSAPFFRILSVAAAGTLTLQRLTLRNGFLAGFASSGGGIASGGTLTLIDCILTRNRAGAGGGLINGGTVTITHTTFAGNAANVPGGGGLFNVEGTVTVANSTFVGNGADVGGGLLNGGGPQNIATVTLTNTTIARNSAAGGRGGAGAFLTSASQYCRAPPSPRMVEAPSPAGRAFLTAASCSCRTQSSPAMSPALVLPIASDQSLHSATTWSATRPDAPSPYNPAT